jgi:hypothetical protein
VLSVGIGIAGLALLAALIFVGKLTFDTYQSMIASPWAALGTSPELIEPGTGEDISKRRYAYIEHDNSQEGVPLPISREERLATKKGPSEQSGPQDQSRENDQTCQEAPIDTGYSDLCAQWYGVAAARFGNRIAAENFRSSTAAMLLTGLGLILTALAVAIAAFASRDASRAVKLMKEGMLPYLSVRPAGDGNGPRFKLINAGTGVARDIIVSVGQDVIPIRRRVLQAGEEISVSRIPFRPGDTAIIIGLRYADGPGDVVTREERFAFDGDQWIHQI